MAIKKLAYSTRHQLESVTRKTFRHAHVHELLAACLGFKSNAALHTNHVLAVLEDEPDVPIEHLLTLQKRLVELGYAQEAEAAGSALLQVVRRLRLAAVSMETVLRTLNGDMLGHGGDWEWDDDDDIASDEQNQAVAYPPSLALEEPELLIDGLTQIAKRGNATAHVALALIYRGDQLEGEPRPGLQGEYWHSQLMQGRELRGIELEWAQDYVQMITNAGKGVFHRQEAARLGYAPARLELALDGAYRAEQEGDLEEAKRCYFEAASMGNVEAMLELIEEYDRDNFFQNWVWVFFSALLGRDLQQSTLRAYHDGGRYAGQEYDDDQGGPLYVSGHEGVHLTPLSSEQEAEAKRTAGELLSRM